MFAGKACGLHQHPHRPGVHPHPRLLLHDGPRKPQACVSLLTRVALVCALFLSRAPGLFRPLPLVVPRLPIGVLHTVPAKMCSAEEGVRRGSIGRTYRLGEGFKRICDKGETGPVVLTLTPAPRNNRCRNFYAVFFTLYLRRLPDISYRCFLARHNPW